MTIEALAIIKAYVDTLLVSAHNARLSKMTIAQAARDPRLLTQLKLYLLNLKAALRNAR